METKPLEEPPNIEDRSRAHRIRASPSGLVRLWFDDIRVEGAQAAQAPEVSEQLWRVYC